MGTQTVWAVVCRSAQSSPLNSVLPYVNWSLCLLRLLSHPEPSPPLIADPLVGSLLGSLESPAVSGLLAPPVPDDPPTERAAGSPRTSPLPSRMPLSFSLAPGTCRSAFRTLQDTLLANMSDTSLTADWSASDLPPLYLDAHPFTWTSLFGHTSLPWASALG
jgi:hypothetical protein